MEPRRLGLFPTPLRRQRTVLLVDDDPLTLQVFAGFVRGFGYVPYTASSAEDALEILTSQSGDAVEAAVVDIRMPGRDGAWLIDQLTTNYPWIRIVIATGMSELDSRLILGRSVVGYLIKPFGAEQLGRMLDEIWPDESGP